MNAPTQFAALTHILCATGHTSSGFAVIPFTQEEEDAGDTAGARELIYARLSEDDRTFMSECIAGQREEEFTECTYKVVAGATPTEVGYIFMVYDMCGNPVKTFVYACA